VPAFLLAALLATSPPVALAPAPAPGAGRPAKAAAPKPAAGPRPARARPPTPPPLSRVLLGALAEVGLDELQDAGPAEGRCPGDPTCTWPLPRVAGPPHLDLAVIRLDAAGRAVEAANVLLEPGAREGRVVKLDRNLAATGVRFRRWAPERRDGAVVAPFSAADDVSASRRSGADFMSPYPASVFKLLVAFHVERRVAQGALRLGEVVTEAPAPPAADGAEEPPPPESRPLDEWLERMVTESDNRATKAVLRHLHARGEVARLNRDLAGLGLDTLRVDGTIPADGGRWAPGEIHAGAMDVARLLWLVAGGPGVMWRTPAGAPVTRQVLPEAARKRLQARLADQGLHEVLSSGSVCGAGPVGIPALVPARFLDRLTGFETAGGQAWGHDVRPCNAAAEVRFLHKTGLTWNYASDAGLVEPLPGKPFRRYVVVVVSAAGSRFVDPERAAGPRHPCEAEQVCVTRRLARLGAAIDAWAVGAAARDRRRRR
jgi:beta-lactamase family protein